MSVHLDLADIQGNILRAYGKQSFPKARFFFLHFGERVGDPAARRLVERLRPKITPATRWAPEPARAADPAPREHAHAHAKSLKRLAYPGEVKAQKPKVAINIAFTFTGLYILGVPTRTLRAMPDEFIDGMAARAMLLGDPTGADDDRRDAIWKASLADNRVHAMVMLNAQMDPATGKAAPELEAESQFLRDLCGECAPARILTGHGPLGRDDHQDASALIARDGEGRFVVTGGEHFGFTDGFGDPIFEGQYSKAQERELAPGRGKIAPGRDGEWSALATGEFLLGYPDEAQEIPGAALPVEFSRNGTFIAWRKLHQNVQTFRDHVAGAAPAFAKVADLAPNEAGETLMAKMVGRWRDGVPLAAAPTFAQAQAFRDTLASGSPGERAQAARDLLDFRFVNDPDGARCPLGAHIRRGNPRDMLDPTADLGDPAKRSGSALANRRRILRRGLPYGEGVDDRGEHGLIFIAICASLFRQFEFVQQQWIEYGLDFNAGAQSCPLIGRHDPKTSKYVVPAGPGSKRGPFIDGPLPNFVEFRGGDYFFVPSLTALRLIGMGIIDPT